jgi:hypothetical protein
MQKVVVAFHMLAYATPADAFDGYIRIGENTALEALRKSVAVVMVLMASPSRQGVF